MQATRHTPVGHTSTGLHLFTVLVTSVLLTTGLADFASAQSLTLQPGMSPHPCSDAPVVAAQPYHPAIQNCEVDLAVADPNLRFGAGLTDTDPNGGHFDFERTERMRLRTKRPSRPDEIARLLTRAYGRHSLLSRSANKVADIAGKAEQQSDKALSGVNSAADKLVLGAQTAIGAKHLPRLRIRSKISTRYLGLGLRADW